MTPTDVEIEQEMNAEQLYYSQKVDEQHIQSKVSQISGSRKARSKYQFYSNPSSDTDHEKRILQHNSSRLSAGFKIGPNQSSMRKISNDDFSDKIAEE